MSGNSPTQPTQNKALTAPLTFSEAKPDLLPLLPDGLQTHPADLKKLEFLWADLTALAPTLPELAEAALPLLTDATENYTAEHTVILLEAHILLHDIYETFSAVTEWTPDILTAVIANLAQYRGRDMNPVTLPLSTALTARTTGLSLPRLMAALGQNECLRRLKAALNHVHENGGHHH